MTEKIMSLLGKKWVILSAGHDDLLNVLMSNRGVEDGAARAAFLTDGLKQTHSPLQLKDMSKAVERLTRARQAGERIMIFGDYDVDGMTATALLLDCLKRHGAQVSYTLPDRQKDGYGLKEYFIRRFADQGVSVLVTVDCGTANYHEIALAKELNIDVIVVDHHQIPERLPPAHALINPYQEDCPYPFRHLCGSTLAYKLVRALENTGWPKGDDHFQLSLVAMGIVADCVPLQDENRILLKAGLEALKRTTHPGLSALLEVAGVKREKIDTIAIGFYIAPRLNAAGRLETPEHALQLLLGQTEKAAVLNRLNQERQGVVEQCMEQALLQLAVLETVPRIIVLAHADWRSGVLGLIASKITDKFQRPTIACSDQGEHLVASCRSLNDFDITGFLRKEVGELFSAFGGHKMAGGFTLPKAHWEAFKSRVESAAQGAIDPQDFQGTLSIDCELPSHAINFQTLQEVQRIAPFGVQNAEPTFVVRNLRILDVRPVGNGKHVQLRVGDNTKNFSAIAFRWGEHEAKVRQLERADIVFNLELNEWNGNKNLQLKVVDVAKVVE